MLCKSQTFWMCCVSKRIKDRTDVFLKLIDYQKHNNDQIRQM